MCERNLWSEKEISAMLNIIKDQKLLKIINGKLVRNKNIYTNVAAEMKRRGFNKKNFEQIKTKFRFMKSDFYKIKRNNSKNGASRQTYEHYDLLEEIFGTNSTINDSKNNASLMEESCWTADDTIKVTQIQDQNVDEIVVEAQEIQETNETKNTRRDKSFKSAKKKTYASVVANFSTEWQQEQNNLVKQLKEQDEEFFRREEELMDKSKNDMEDMLQRNRMENMKMMKHLIKSLQQQNTINSYTFPTQTIPPTTLSSTMELPNKFTLTSSNLSASQSPNSSTSFSPIHTKLESPTTDMNF